MLNELSCLHSKCDISDFISVFYACILSCKEKLVTSFINNLFFKTRIFITYPMFI